MKNFAIFFLLATIIFTLNYSELAAQDHSKSLASIPQLAEQGKKVSGVKRDYDRAIQLLLRAASKGQTKAQYTLGVMYQKGLGVKQDYTQAVEWYRKAA